MFLFKEGDHFHLGNRDGSQTYGYENIQATVKTAFEASLGLYEEGSQEILVKQTGYYNIFVFATGELTFTK